MQPVAPGAPVSSSPHSPSADRKLANLSAGTRTNIDEIKKMADEPGIRRVGSGASDVQQMAQIRELLFGEQQRRTGDHLARLDARIAEQDTALRALLDERVAELTRLADALRDGLAQQQRNQQAGLDAVESTLRSLLTQLDERVTLLDGDLHATAARLGDSLDRQAAAQEHLARASVDRAQLADLLEGVARHLRTPPDA